MILKPNIANNPKEELQAIWAAQDAWRVRQGLPKLTEEEAEELIKQATVELKAKSAVGCNEA